MELPLPVPLAVALALILWQPVPFLRQDGKTSFQAVNKESFAEKHTAFEDPSLIVSTLTKSDNLARGIVKL